MAQVKITIRPNGPYRVEAPEGSVELVDANGNKYDLTGKPAFSLCRCGGSVNQHTRAFALGHFFERLTNHERIQPKCVLVNAAVFQRERRGFSVGDHDDLFHILALALKDALSKAQAFPRVGVVGADLNPSKLAKRDLFSGIVE